MTLFRSFCRNFLLSGCYWCGRSLNARYHSCDPPLIISISWKPVFSNSTRTNNLRVGPILRARLLPRRRKASCFWWSPFLRKLLIPQPLSN